MIITCGECRASFKLSDTMIKPSGSKVRCSKCKHVFIVFPKPLEPEIAISDTASVAEAESSDSGSPFTSQKRLEFGLEDIEKAVEPTFPGVDLSISENFFSISDTPAGGKKTGETAGFELKEEGIDLSDLEKMLEFEGPPENGELKDSEEKMDELKIELDLYDSTREAVKTESAGAPKDEKLDLSDIEKLLDLEPSEKKGETEDSLDDLDLELDFGDAYKPDEIKTAEPSFSETEELDLSDLEKMLRTEEEPKSADDAVAPEEDSAPAMVDFASIFEKEAKPAETLQEGDLQLEYELETDLFADASETAVPGRTEERKTVDSNAERFGIGELPPEGADREDDILTEAEEPAEMEKPERKERKRRIGTPVLVMLLLVLITGAGFGAFYVLDSQNIRVPYISDFLNPKAPDAGNLKMGTFDITSNFVENSKTGRLFLISGKVKNEYPEPRGMIRITGKLFTGGKNVAKTETVFCGNVLSESEISTLDSESIKRKLANQFGDNRSNVRVEPGRMIPFMIVFSNLPENLEEFSIEVAGSMPVK